MRLKGIKSDKNIKTYLDLSFINHSGKWQHHFLLLQTF